MSLLTAALYGALALYLGGWFLGYWVGNFALLLAILTFVTLAYWLAERFHFAPTRAAAAARLERDHEARRAELNRMGIFQPAIDEFLASIELPKVESVKPPISTAPANPPSNNIVSDKFTTTNFDDGWVGVAKSDWVEVTKGQVRVLLHYPKAGTDIPGDPEPRTVNAWNILVAPRYSNLKGFKTVSPSLDFQRSYLGAGFLTDNATGRPVFVSLFQKTGGWIEVITPDKETFVQNFGFDINNVAWDTDTGIFNPLARMGNYNKFGISTSDFDGEWTDRFAANTFYTNIYTGLSAGMSSYSSNESFAFTGFKNYSWHLVAVNSGQGRSTFAQGKSAGTFKVLNPWQISFSNIEGKPKTYSAYFSYIKGGKVLWMRNAEYSGDIGYTGYALKTK